VIAFLFDIDGMLVDSTDAVEAAWRQVALEHGADADAILRVCHGRRDEDVVPEFFSPDLAPAVIQRIAELELELADQVRPVPDAPAILNRIPADSWAAVTSGSRPLMTARLRGAGLPVPAVFIAGEDVSRGKPDPEGFLLAARRLGVQPASCVVVEDSPAGVAAGKAAGAFVVGVASTHEPDALVAANVVVDRLSGIRGAVMAFSAATEVEFRRL
jgi:sugar-phosphatase